MGLVDRLFRGAIDKAVEERLQAAASASLDEPGFRKLTGAPTRELPAVTQERMIEISYWLWETNPLAAFIIEIMTAFVVSDGLPFNAKHPDVKALLDKFWNDPVNKMDLYQDMFLRELGIYGEQCWPVFTAAQTGLMRLGYIDPAQIDKVVTDPENVKLAIGVKLKSETCLADGKKYQTILDGESAGILSKRAVQLRESFNDGECFFFGINRVTNKPRGKSDLFTVADWLDAYEQFMFDFADRWPLLLSFIWDVELTGKKEDEIKTWLKDNASPKPGSMRAHNENVKWEAVTPDLKAVDASAGSRLLRNHILGAKGIPEHWYGGGGDVNRATASEMGTPAFKMITARQRLWKHILEALFRAQIRKALDAGYLKVKEDEAFDFTVQVQEIDQDDLGKYATALTGLSSSLVAAQTQGWIDEEVAGKIFAFGLGFIGYELDAEKINDSLERKGYEDYKDKNRKDTPEPKD